MRFRLFAFGILSLQIMLWAGGRVKPQKAVESPPKIKLKGSDESQRWQNYMADSDGLIRIENHRQLLNFEKIGFLVRLPETKGIRIDPRLSVDDEYCYVRPWTRVFLENIASAFAQRFPEESFQINSAVRDRARQKELQKKNPNAAAVYGPKASSHLTGATVDITKRKMSAEQIVWMRKTLLALAKQRLIWVTEETANQTVFHIMVFKKYWEPETKEKK